MKRIGILGSTGSIGVQTLDVIRQFPDQFQVVALSAGNNLERLADQIQAFSPEIVSVGSEENIEPLRQRLRDRNIAHSPQILAGEEGLMTLAAYSAVESLIVGLVGFVGLLPTLKALETGKQVLTANKETFVTAGHLVQPYISQIVPLDSEHSAIFQCLQGAQHPKEVSRIYLTASGGPFRDYALADLAHVSVEQALSHPNWLMGEKVTIDSATMMNKGLETLEAHFLFGLPMEKIDIVVHPQSIVHSAVAFVDGSILAQLGQPDMRLPIQYGLTYPERWTTTDEALHLDLATLGSLQFLPVDMERFPCLKLARWAADKGGTLPVVLNAADEMAVQAFLQHQISFLEIPRLIERAMQQHEQKWEAFPNLESIINTDAWTRTLCRSLLPVPV
jgi:1-deoxy-D-xylulose-5-phosphate reductoisomerase